MSIHHTSLYNSYDNKPDGYVLKQELITYEQTEFGLKITKLERAFSNGKPTDSYTSTPFPLRQWGKPKQQVSEKEQKELSQLFNDKLIVSVPSKNGGRA